jgi:hypothetical protein
VCFTLPHNSIVSGLFQLSHLLFKNLRLLRIIDKSLVNAVISVMRTLTHKKFGKVIVLGLDLQVFVTCEGWGTLTILISF